MQSEKLVPPPIEPYQLARLASAGVRAYAGGFDSSRCLRYVSSGLLCLLALLLGFYDMLT